MNSLSRSIVVVAIALTALSVSAQDGGKRRAVQQPPTQQGVPVSPPVAPPNDAVLIGTVVDSLTGAPVIAAEVRAGNAITRSDAQGAFTISGRSGLTVTLTITRFGYDPGSASITTVSGTTTQRFPLVAKPTTRVRTITGETFQLATETVEFGYVVPLSGFAKDRVANLCKPDGSSFYPDRDDMRRIEGPARQLTNASCCPAGPISGLGLEMKNGERIQVFFADSCAGYAVQVIGLDNITARLVYLKFADVAEVTFP